jgi:NifB/MoaA-like Fe-S oxidoreductase
VYGSDELYQLASMPFPPAGEYDGFPQVENGVGSVRYLEQLVESQATELQGLAGQRILVCTGKAMGPLMPELFPALERVSGARFELAVLENGFYGPSVTTAGLLPGASFREALAARSGVDLALLPAEAVNADGSFVDDMSFAALESEAPMPVVLSYHFTDALSAQPAR